MSFILIYYIDNTYPQEDDNQRGLLFFLEDLKCWWKRGDKKQLDMILNKDIETQEQIVADLEIFELNKKYGEAHVLKNINLRF